MRLVQCTRITVGGLRLVLESNPGLIKLSIPGCVRLDMESILCCLKSFKSLGFPGIKQLSVGNVQIVTQDQFDELNLLLNIDHKKQVASYKPRFYGAGNLYLSCTDDRPIDIEKCPGCQKFRQVYDCPAESCQGSSAQLCKACLFCITRCINCGHCISDKNYEEIFCLDFVCLYCLMKILKCQEEDRDI
ncbi:F-box protein SKIP14-like [Impatiens glandulifera]|uniref:F-box protein SKIP14-like n=1 Tax=Impatiens glandulifera TaxID=253017 RepID=UPI001FB195AA|nr:F-box protein SKIP14-like [Impatiens glandulifera]